ncbi:hypothetical protein NIES4074_34980 [Cylindrospermum sp. NIES-4074]|nr:hypothetical protein NIES4074_34980 [Cylindrospermum sp. NIES-4074]
MKFGSFKSDALPLTIGIGSLNNACIGRYQSFLLPNNVTDGVTVKPLMTWELWLAREDSQLPFPSRGKNSSLNLHLEGLHKRCLGFWSGFLLLPNHQNHQVNLLAGKRDRRDNVEFAIPSLKSVLHFHVKPSLNLLDF